MNSTGVGETGPSEDMRQKWQWADLEIAVK